MALGLEFGQAREETGERVERVAAFVRHAGVGAPAEEVELELDAAAVAAADGVVARLADDPEGDVEPLGQMARADPADLLLHDAGHPDVARRRTLPERRCHAHHLRRQRPLDVDRAPTPQHAVRQMGLERRMRPPGPSFWPRPVSTRRASRGAGVGSPWQRPPLLAGWLEAGDTSPRIVSFITFQA